MYKVLIWGTGAEYSIYFNCIKLLELKKEIKIVGVTSNDIDIKNSIDGYPFFRKEEISSLQFDYCIIAIKNMNTIVNEAKELGMSEEQLIPVRVLSIPNFVFCDYIKLKKSNISIFSPNCWAGICYHTLGMKFLSPTINMFEDLNDFNELMLHLDDYLKMPIKLEGYLYEEALKRMYPVGKIGDIKLHFNHYVDYESAVMAWETRKKRINRENMVIVSYTESQETLEAFEKLPYKNKLIFTTLKENSPSSCYLNKDDQGRLWAPVNDIAAGKKNVLDIIPFLNHEEHFLRI